MFRVVFHACVYISTLRTHRKQTDKQTDRQMKATRRVGVLFETATFLLRD